VHKDGSHIAEIMTMKDIYNALATAHKSFGETHKRNLKEMTVKFCIRKLAKHRIQNSVRQNQYVRFEDDYEESKVVAEMPSMEITLDEGQDYSEPSETEVLYADGEPILESEPNDDFYADLGDDEEPSDEEWQMAMEEDSRNEVETVSYAKWKNELKGNGYEMVEDSYDPTSKTVKVRKC
jgi:recombinational DNA repair protein RecT